jgi:hypothetical protein
VTTSMPGRPATVPKRTTPPARPGRSVVPPPAPPDVRLELGAWCPLDDTLLRLELTGWSCPACGAAWDHAGTTGWWISGGVDLATRLLAEDGLETAGLMLAVHRSTCGSCRVWITPGHIGSDTHAARAGHGVGAGVWVDLDDDNDDVLVDAVDVGVVDAVVVDAKDIGPGPAVVDELAVADPEAHPGACYRRGGLLLALAGGVPVGLVAPLLVAAVRHWHTGGWAAVLAHWSQVDWRHSLLGLVAAVLVAGCGLAGHWAWHRKQQRDALFLVGEYVTGELAEAIRAQARDAAASREVTGRG